MSTYGKWPQQMQARLCDRCNEQMLRVFLNAPEPIEPEISQLVNELRGAA